MRISFLLLTLILLCIACGGGGSGGGIGGTSDLANNSGGGIGGTSDVAVAVSGGTSVVTSGASVASIESSSLPSSNIFIFDGSLTAVSGTNVITVFSTNIFLLDTATVRDHNNSIISFSNLMIGDNVMTSSNLISGNLHCYSLKKLSSLNSWTIQTNQHIIDSIGITIDDTAFVYSSSTSYQSANLSQISQSEFLNNAGNAMLYFSGNIQSSSNTINTIIIR